MLTPSSVTGNFTAGGPAGYNHRGDIELSFFGLGEHDIVDFICADCFGERLARL